MDLGEIWEISKAIILSCGGAGVIIIGISSLLAKMFQNQLEIKYKQLLDKEMEAYRQDLGKEMEVFKQNLQREMECHKSDLENKRYITKAQFDKEYEIYGQLSKAFGTARSHLAAISYRSFIDDYASDDQRMRYISHVHDMLVVDVKETQDLLYENAPFLPKDIFERYDKVYELILDQYLAFEKKYELLSAGKEHFDSLWDQEFENSYQTIYIHMKNLNNTLREYLNTLTIRE